MRTRNLITPLALLSAVALFSAGCGGKSGGKLTGQVTLNGAPVKAAQVTAYNEKGDVLGRGWATDGRYVLDNLPPGTVLLAVETHSPEGQPLTGGPKIEPKQGPKQPPVKKEKEPAELEALSHLDPVPLKYTSPTHSELKVTVEAGSEKVYDIAMTGKGEIPKLTKGGKPGGPPGGPKIGGPGGPPIIPPGKP
jgi:hypothetical protein